MITGLRKLGFLTLLLLSFCLVDANAIEINNVQRLTTPNRNQVSFELSWQNSWYVSGTPSNHDAAWIFIKYRECGTTGAWNHALFSTTLTDHTLDPGLDFADSIRVTDRLGNPGDHNTGAMLRRASFGTGHIVSLPCTLSVTGGSGGALFADSLDYDIRVFGIEMVYVTEGQFAAGDLAALSNSYRFQTTSSNQAPLIISSEASLSIWGGYCGQRTLPADYPKGFNSFYMMKYEISMGQYADFLNTISGAASTQRYPPYDGLYRFRLNVTGGQYVSARQDRACNYLNWDDLGSYLDWAALRPMTELEYEKACKGDAAMAPGGYAWGSSSWVEARNLSGAEDGTETVTDTDANINAYGVSFYVLGGDGTVNNNNLTRGPIGCGIFARDATQTRETTGGSYYGIMELSGNVLETVITIHAGPSSCAANPTYDGIWGDGLLNASGRWNVTNWPTSSNTQNGPIGCRGGSYDHDEIYSTVGHRYYIRLGGSMTHNRTRTVGGRGVR